MQTVLGDQFDAFLASYDAPPQIGLRVNTLKLTPAEFRARSPFPLEPLPWTPAGFRLRDPQSRPGLHPYHAAGLYYIQEPSAQAVAEVLDPRPGERVLDLAAAPGGKTTHIAAKMQNQGLLLANEIRPKRARDLTKNLERWGARNVIIANETPDRLASRLPAFFDRVLVDAPCSGEGMFRKTPQAIRHWSPEFVQGCALRQKAILHTAAKMVRPGGWLCYATCTFAPEENEHVIAHFLQHHPDFHLAPPPLLPSSPPPLLSSSPLRLWPHTSPGEGHFIALLRRESGIENRESRIENRKASSRKRESNTHHSPLPHLLPHWQTFARESLDLVIDPARLRLVKSYLYALPPQTPDLRGLRLLRPGWWLGSFKKDRFEPSHALAMALRGGQARRSLDLDLHTARAYLRRQTLPSEGQDGWTLVTLEGFPLGWGKRVRGRLKNHYPKALRIAHE